jgi:hypothetical protein
MKDVQSNRGFALSLNALFDLSSFDLSEITVKPRMTRITLTVVLLRFTVELTVIVSKSPLRFHPLDFTRSLLPLDLVCPIALAPHCSAELVPQSIWSPAQLRPTFGLGRHLIWSSRTDA